MQHFVRGFEKHITSSEEFKRRWELIAPYIRAETSETVKQSITAIVGPELNTDGTQNWPYAISCLMNKRSMCPVDRFLWGAFCYLNKVPFGLMIAYPHVRGMIEGEEEYTEMMDSYCLWMSDKMQSMEFLAVKHSVS